MKTYYTVLLFTAVTLWSGCAFGSRDMVLGPVGPQLLTADALAPKGYMKVYSSTEGHNDGDVHYYPHTSYTVYSDDGRTVVKKVANAISIHDEDPALVDMPAGNYTVLAESEYYGMVKIKVVIEPGKLTTVNLEYNNPSPHDLSNGSADLVRLPNGSVVGWRAKGSPQASAVGPTQKSSREN
jgi:hypothetical protein